MMLMVVMMNEKCLYKIEEHGLNVPWIMFFSFIFSSTVPTDLTTDAAAFVGSEASNMLLIGGSLKPNPKASARFSLSQLAFYAGSWSFRNDLKYVAPRK